MKKNKIKIISKVLSWYAYLSGYRPGRVDDCNKNTINCIVIYSTTALGDLILNTPAIYALKAQFPQARLVMVSSPKNRGLVEGSDIFDDVIYWNNKFNNILYFIFKLRKIRPQLAVILHSYFPYDILTAVLSGCRFIFRDHYGKENVALNHWLTAYSPNFQGHTVQRKLQLVSPLGCDVTQTRMRIPVVISAANREPGRQRIGFQLGASRDFRRWPVACFAALCDRLCDRPAAEDAAVEIILIGGKNEQVLVEEFMALVAPANRQRVSSLVGRTTLPQLAAAITTFDILVTGDTGPLHVAIAQRVRTVSLFVTANPLYTGPYQDLDRHRVFYKPISSLPPELARSRFPMAAITPAEVFDAVAEGLRHADAADLRCAV